jgi:DNA-binding LacI/PurR family transcriptional regulator
LSTPKERRPTVATVAERAQVSRQTVSNALNAPHLVRPETLARVQAAIAELGYRPHRAARTLRTQRSYLIAATMNQPADGIGGALLDRFLHALTLRSQERGYRVLLYAADDDAGEIAAYDELLTDHDLDAFVLTGTHAGDKRTEWLAGRGAAFVTFGRPWGATAHHGWVDVDGATGTRSATEHLLARGHRRIGFLGWPTGSDVGDDRRDGWRQACEAAGTDTSLACSFSDSLDNGRRGCADLLDLAEPVTAFVCVSDSLALGVWTELTARGLRPGGDVAVTGFDDSPAAGVIGLTSVAQPVDEVAQACLQMLHDVIGVAEPSDTPPEPVLLPPTLVVRDTT